MRTSHCCSGGPHLFPCIVQPIIILVAVCVSSFIRRSSEVTPTTHIGLFLALALYGPQYSAMSPYIRGTPRNDPTFIWACTAIWAVSSLFFFFMISSMDLTPCNQVRRDIQSNNPHQPSQPSSSWVAQTCYPPGIRFLTCVFPQLFLRKSCLVRYCPDDRKLDW